jgi:oligo-1,6-glucosidase
MECDQRGVKCFKKRFNVRKLMRTLTKWQDSVPWNALYFENHDQPRFISRLPGGDKYRAEASRMVAGLLMTLRGTPFVYQGQEIGMTNGDFSCMDEIEDIESHNVYSFAKKLLLSRNARFRMIKKSSRDNARTPMQWSGEEGAGFTSGDPWLKINKNHTWINVEWEDTRDDGILDFWKKMIAKRKSTPALCDGSFKAVLEGRRLFAFERALDGTTYLSICNMSAKAVKLPKKLGGGKIEVSSYRKPQTSRLMPFEFRLVKLSEGTENNR